ncbi:Phospholipase A(1) DAD1, chloroplastic [Apostasia shenzhenica]|uniref:Phospholipase A(1) DAD1, chloroplastic n=1 Tax=Apostasia shenzhenica TaxID=1088818 RepID=A0A2I0BEW2_9ASPA|nr:Phospholipase A(1) DAD1, chloroplastic [Apostasia shenzhenica]
MKSANSRARSSAMKISTSTTHIRPSCSSCPIIRRSISSSAATLPRQATSPAGVRLGRRWPEFQGSRNWDGLLDPLDDTLRSEILRYGAFVQAAYASCDFDPSSPSYATCRFPKHSLLGLAGLPSTGYRVTRSLHATAGSRLPSWAADAAAQHSPAWISRSSSWIGYVAVCQDHDEITRLGRRDIVVALRGTATFLEWLDNLHAALTHLPSAVAAVAAAAASGCGCSGIPEPMVQHGFWSLFTTGNDSYSSLRDQVRDEVRRLVGEYGDEEISLTIAGHSLGAALAVLVADDVKAMLGAEAPMVSVVSFGGPRVGNGSFRRRMEEQGSKVLRIVNCHDIITKVPGFVIDGEEEDGAIPSWLLSKTGWAYADIGRELRLRGRRTANVVACHDLSHYLQLVKQISGPSPFVSREDRQPGRWRWPAIVAGDAS